jgi:hypothetical protein
LQVEKQQQLAATPRNFAAKLEGAIAAQSWANGASTRLNMA